MIRSVARFYCIRARLPAKIREAIGERIERKKAIVLTAGDIIGNIERKGRVAVTT
jgi:hypothetical protein